MAMPLSALKIGMVLVIIGSVWTGIIFSNAIKESKNIVLERLDSAKISVDLTGDGIGYYVISTDSYNNILLAKILDSQGHYIDIKRITNKITVNYFPFDRTGDFSLEITNFDDRQVKLATEIGDTKFQGFVIPASIVLLGTILLVFSGYKKLYAYITAQPDENI